MAPVVTPRRLAVALAVVAVVMAVVGLALDRPSEDEGEPATGVPTVDEAAARSFVDAWRQSLTGTYLAVSSFQRRTGAGGELTSESIIAQRPPDRVAVGGGSVDARIDGRLVACATDADGTVRCRDGGTAPPYDEFVEARVERVAELVLGDEPLYAVEDVGGGCYRLRLRAAVPAPPYGLVARFCFDAETGAAVETEIRRDDSVDRTVAVELRAEVLDEDLDLPGEEERGS